MKTSKNNQDDDIENVPGYPIYHEREDIYNQFKEEDDIDPEDISKMKTANDNDQNRNNHNGKSIEGEFGSDVDVPGSELDNKQEEIGSEDEENNYYSLGGDNHSDLDEDDGD